MGRGGERGEGWRIREKEGGERRREKGGARWEWRGKWRRVEGWREEEEKERREMGWWRKKEGGGAFAFLTLGL